MTLEQVLSRQGDLEPQRQSPADDQVHLRIGIHLLALELAGVTEGHVQPELPRKVEPGAEVGQVARSPPLGRGFRRGVQAVVGGLEIDVDK